MTAFMLVQADVQLVVDVGDEAYLAIDKGPISDTHVLILSVEHYPNTMTLQSQAYAELHRLVDALARAYKSRDMVLVGFERFATCYIATCYVATCNICLSENV
jgi:diadenosine tetraphosphate (Ap4A) HIT family hydrolase